MNSSEVAVIGAGISGLICARVLRFHGLSVTLFDKGRRPGGRILSRNEAFETFDHGAQFFTVRDLRFSDVVLELQAAGHVAPWEGRFVSRAADGRLRSDDGIPRWVGTPSMGTIGVALAADLEVQCSTCVARMVRRDGAWALFDANDRGLGQFAQVVVALPAAQALHLLADTSLAPVLKGVNMAPCWALMLSFSSRVPVTFDALRCATGSISWLANDSSKPFRDPGERWVVHASPEFSFEHLDAKPEQMEALMSREMQNLVGVMPQVQMAKAHRWRYALAVGALDAPCLYEANLGLGACGDWCTAPRIESAALSGFAMADRLLGKPLEEPISQPILH